MKKFIFISLVLNLALLGAVAVLKSKNSQQTIAEPAKHEIFPARFKNRKARSKSEIINVNVSGEKFSWSAVESADYKDYIANLRRLQCPEETIRDIIIADIEKLFAAKLKPLRKPPEPYRYWESDNHWSGRSESREFYAEQKRLEKEKKEVLKELLGLDYEDILMQIYGIKKSTDEFGKNLSQEVKDQLAEIQQRFSEQADEVRRKAKGYYDTETQTDLRKIEQQQFSEMAKVLSPEDLFEFQLRNSSVIQEMKWNELSGFDATEEEFRAIAKAKLASEAAQANAEEDSGAARTAEKSETAALKEALGEERYKEYQRNKDWDYRQLVELTERRGIAKEEAVKIYEMKSDVEKAVRDIKKDKTLTPEQQREKLLAVKQATEQEVQASLGERGFKAWKNRAWWFQNINP